MLLHLKIGSPVVLAGHSYGAVTGTLAMPQIKGRFADLAMKLCVII